MLSFRYVAVFALAAVAFGQDFDYDSSPPRPAPHRVKPSYSGPAAPRPTPVPILKQINRHNEDGSYTYGYEGADGSFKIETKLPTGEVKGKYGYVDDTGKVRVVEYGATKYGFEPAGEGITVAPPTLVDETTNKDGTLNPEYAGSYYDDQPQIPARSAPAPRPQIQPQFDFSGPQQFSPTPQRSSAPVPPRAVIPGSSPVTTHNFEFGPSPRPAPKSYAPAARSYAPAPRPAPRPAPVSYARPAPIEEDFGEPEQAPIRSQPRITYAQPAPQRNHISEPQFAPAARPAPQYAPRPQSAPVGRSGGILDQLSKDYALPQGGAAPLHDISFGYY
ncbi:cuticular protein precursor [Tribolium castaneum]|uniref:Uncharacterized protein n=1 Tax=Tribolium castaneum TaxID=7070 RepID=D6WA93_TRICA|nr:cuticular protein precursor [Tribolium castaneum]EEZ98600.2 hypothetical protein TcasGA2_TC001119 [Tribolium castaneum]|eukprot:NP_001161316.1 cuticular protein precursor [Tribolium castaneum]